MLLLISLSIIIVLYKINKIVLKQGYKILNPVSSLLMIWAAVYVCHSIYFPEKSTTVLTYLCTLVGLINVVIGFWIAYSKDKYYHVYNRTYNVNFLKRLICIFIIVDLFRLLYSMNLVVNNLAGGALYMLLSEGTTLRRLYLNYTPSLYEKIFSFCSNLFCYIGYVILGIYVANKQKNGWRIFFFITLVEFAISFVTMSKLSFTLFLFAFFITYLNKQKTVEEQKKRIMTILPFVIAVLVGFFFFIGFQRNYMETKDGLSSGVLDGIINYFAGPLEAFNVYMEKGPHIFRAEHGMVDIGRTETNVFTWYIYFIKNLSYIGIFICPFINGFFAGKLYRPMRQNLLYDVANSWICVFFSFSFFDYLLKFTVYQALFLVVWFINIQNKRRMYIYE